MTDEPRPVSTTALRRIYRKYLHTARTQAEAAQFLAACAELGERGWRLNAKQTDWIPPLKTVDKK